MSPQTWVVTTTKWLTLHVSSNLNDNHHWVTHTLHVPKTWVIITTGWLSQYITPQTQVVTHTKCPPNLGDHHHQVTQLHVNPNLNDHHNWVTLTVHVPQTWVVSATYVTVTTWLPNLSGHPHWVNFKLHDSPNGSLYDLEQKSPQGVQ